MKAVSLMNSTEVGRSNPSTTATTLPSRSIRNSFPVFGEAGRPAFTGMLGQSHRPCERTYNVCFGPSSTSTASLAPEASGVASVS